MNCWAGDANQAYGLFLSLLTMHSSGTSNEHQNFYSEETVAASLSRLTLYALISATEEDMRELLETYSPHGASTEPLLGSALLATARSRAYKDQAATIDNLQLGDLLQYCDFGDLLQLLSSIKTSLPEDIRKNIVDLTPQIGALVQIRNRVMHARPLDFDDLPTYSSATELLLKGGGTWPHLDKMTSQIKDRPEFLLKLEIPKNSDDSKVSHNLPIPDFDETGFIGRRALVDRIRKACTGVYPVVTIVGEGGLGKTALALRVAYDIVDSPECPFEAVVFVSAKTTMLTTSEVKRIHGAVNDSMGLIQKAVSALGGGEDDPIEELLSLLAEFKVLLIIDNLETVVDHHFRRILENIPEGSHILMTSRIGLGAFEYPFVLPELPSSEAVQLLLATARVRGVTKLVEASNARLAEFCGRMQNNPLYIKWLVSAVQAGKRPEDALANNRLFLQFCLSNVYGKISTEAQAIVRVLLAVGGTFTIPELAFMTDMSELELLRAVQELMRTNMLTMTSAALGRTFETKYELAQLARKYLSQFHPVGKEEQRRLLGIKQRLMSAGEELTAIARSEQISITNINVRNRSDWVVAKYLRDAIATNRRGREEDAASILERARSFAPDYFEVHRVAAYIDAQNGNISGAMENYEKALELEPESISTLVMFATFLMRDMGDAEQAKPYLERARMLAPNNLHVRIEFARCCTYQRDFTEARAAVFGEEIPANAGDNIAQRLTDIRIQVLQREADFLAERGEAAKSLIVLAELISFVDSATDVDLKIVERLRKLGPTFGILRRSNLTEEQRAHLAEVEAWHQQRAGKRGPTNDVSPMPDAPSRTRGEICRYPPRANYGFIRSTGGREYFFHRNSVANSALQNVLQEGMQVAFIEGVDWRGRSVALDIDTPA